MTMQLWPRADTLETLLWLELTWRLALLTKPETIRITSKRTVLGDVEWKRPTNVSFNIRICIRNIRPGPWLNINISSYQYRKSHCGDKTVVRSSYLHNGISYTGKMISLYWIGAQGMCFFSLQVKPVCIHSRQCSIVALIISFEQHFINIWRINAFRVIIYRANKCGLMRGSQLVSIPVL